MAQFFPEDWTKGNFDTAYALPLVIYYDKSTNNIKTTGASESFIFTI